MRDTRTDLTDTVGASLPSGLLSAPAAVPGQPADLPIGAGAIRRSYSLSTSCGCGTAGRSCGCGGGGFHCSHQLWLRDNRRILRRRVFIVVSSLRPFVGAVASMGGPDGRVCALRHRTSVSDDMVRYGGLGQRWSGDADPSLSAASGPRRPVMAVLDQHPRCLDKPVVTEWETSWFCQRGRPIKSRLHGPSGQARTEVRPTWKSCGLRGVARRGVSH